MDHFEVFSSLLSMLNCSVLSLGAFFGCIHAIKHSFYSHLENVHHVFDKKSHSKLKITT